MTITQRSTRPKRWSILWAVLLMGLAVPVLASQVREVSSATGEAAALLAETVTLQQGLDGYAGAADAYLRSGVLEENNGGTSALKIGRKGETYNALLRFDLQGHIPSNAAVLTATLHLYPYDSDLASPMTMEAYRALVPWEELEANWNVRAAGTPWAGPGCSGEGVDYAAGGVGSASVLDTGVWYALDVTAAVSAWVGGEANHGLLLLASPDSLPANTFYFRTREYVSVDQRPRLVITYDASGPTPSPTETLTPTTSPTATETGEPGVTPSASPTQDPRRTPLPDSLYPYPELRAGVVAFETFGLPLASLNTKLIKLEDRGPNRWDSRLGMDSITVILEDTTR